MRVDVTTTHPSHRHLRHGDGDAGRDAEAQGARRARLGPGRLPADERLPRGRRHPGAQRLPRRAHHRRPRPRRRRQRDLARQPRARGSARSEDPLLLAARGHSRALPLGRALDRHRRHARQDDDDVADRLAADARRRRSERARRRHRAQLRRARLELPHRAGARLRHRRRRVRQRVLRQDGEVPEVPARHRRHQQRRVRSRGHLRRPRRGDAGVPPARQPRAAARACCCSAPTARARARWRRGAVSRVETFGTARRRRLAGARSRAAGGVDAVPGPARRVAVRRVRGAAGRRAQRAERAGGDRGRHRGRHRRRSGSPRACGRSPASSGGSKSSARPTA